MTIYAKIKEDFKEARKKKEAGTVSLLSTVIGEMDNEASRSKSGDKTVTDEVAIKVLKSFAKNLAEVNSICGSDKTEIELIIVETYLPEQLTEDGIRTAIRSSGLTAMKDIMAHLKANYAGLYDGKVASTVAKEFA